MLPRLGFTEQCESKNIPESTHTHGKVVHMCRCIWARLLFHIKTRGNSRRDKIVLFQSAKRRDRSKCRESPPPPPFSHSLPHPPPFAIFLSLLVQTGGERERMGRGEGNCSLFTSERVSEEGGIDFPIPSSHLYVPT